MLLLLLLLASARICFPLRAKNPYFQWQSKARTRTRRGCPNLNQIVATYSSSEARLTLGLQVLLVDRWGFYPRWFNRVWKRWAKRLGFRVLGFCAICGWQLESFWRLEPEILGSGLRLGLGLELRFGFSRLWKTRSKNAMFGVFSSSPKTICRNMQISWLI